MTPPDDLGPFLERAWTLLTRGTVDAKSAANRPTLGTSGPELRTVVLRAVDRQAGTLDIHSDARAAKIAQIAADPAVALHIWDAKAHLQIRMRGQAEVQIDTAEARAIFARLPAHGQPIYTVQPDPGTVIDGPEQPAPTGAPHFALLRITLSEIELLHLDRSRHSRALYTRATGWAGCWLVP